MKQKFFFYGTLLHEVENEHTIALHKKLAFEGPGLVMGRLFAVEHDGMYYPALIPSEVGYPVYGNIYTSMDNFSDLDLQQIDTYEEYYSDNLEESEYVRKEIPVISINGTTTNANVYLYNQSPSLLHPELTNGSFLSFLEESGYKAFHI